MNLLIGASGLLGRHLKIQAERPTSDELDITKFIIPEKYDLIILVAAYTDTAKAETERWKCFDVNVNGVMNVLEAYPNTPLVFISSEYAKNPVNFYSLTKRLGEQLVEFHTAPYLILRVLFKPYPYPHEFAFTDQYTFGDTVNVMAPLIDKAIQEWDKKNSATRLIGTGRKTMFELAKKSKPDVKPNSGLDMKIKLPMDYD